MRYFEDFFEHVVGEKQCRSDMLKNFGRIAIVLLLEDAEYLRTVMSNCGMGLLFAALGVFGLLRRTKQEVSAVRVIDL